MFALKVHVNIVLPYVNNSGLNEGQIASKVSICWHQQCGILKARLSPHDARQKIMNGLPFVGMMRTTPRNMLNSLWATKLTTTLRSLVRTMPCDHIPSQKPPCEQQAEDRGSHSCLFHKDGSC